MESAGRALVEPVLSLLASSARARGDGRPVRAVCGVGNNGGDGFVAVRHLLAEGVAAEAVLVGDPDRLPADAAANWRRLVERAGRSDGSSLRAARRCGFRLGRVARRRERCDRRALRDGAAPADRGRDRAGDRRAERRARARSPGRRGRSAVGHRRRYGPDPRRRRRGRSDRHDLAPQARSRARAGPQPSRDDRGRARRDRRDPDPGRPDRIELWNARAAGHRFPVRARDGHKGRFGHVLVAAGSTGKWGAASLSARAALRAGAGLVTLVLPDVAGLVLPNLCAEIMTERAPATASGGFAEAACEADRGARADADRGRARAGPRGSIRRRSRCVLRLLGNLERPLVVDADGLNALGGDLGMLRSRRAPTILTPIPARRRVCSRPTRRRSTPIASGRRGVWPPRRGRS
jgi:hypothetical protein